MRSSTAWCLAVSLSCAALAPSGEGWGVPAPWEVRKDKPPLPEILLDAPSLARELSKGGVLLLDARSAPRFRQGYLPGSKNLPANGLAPDPARILARLEECGLSPGDRIVCYGDAREPVEAGRLFWLLELAGFSGVRVLNGGLEAWRAAGRPVESTGGSVATTRRPSPNARTRPRPDPDRLATYDDVRAAFGRHGMVLLDWRETAAWEAGHVPYSLPFPWTDLAVKKAPAGTLVPADSVRRRFERFGPRDLEFMALTDTVVVCGDVGPADLPAHPYLACRVAGIARVKNWPGGWSGWSKLPDGAIVSIVDTKSVRARTQGSTFPWTKRTKGPVPLVLDVRGEADWDAGHVPGALSLPSHRFEHDLDSLVAVARPGFDRTTTPLILYCYGPSCTRSRNCAAYAARLGFQKLEWYREGIEGWRGAGLPVEEGKRADADAAARLRRINAGTGP